MLAPRVAGLSRHRIAASSTSLRGPRSAPTLQSGNDRMASGHRQIAHPLAEEMARLGRQDPHLALALPHAGEAPPQTPPPPPRPPPGPRPAFGEPPKSAGRPAPQSTAGAPR